MPRDERPHWVKHWESPGNQARLRELERLGREYDETHQYKEPCQDDRPKTLRVVTELPLKTMRRGYEMMTGRKAKPQDKGGGDTDPPGARPGKDMGV